jgi:sirohydrochlorin ferrochelatase
MGTDAIILIAHGSRETLANDEVCALANQLAEQIGTSVETAFLDTIAKPNLPEIIDKVAASGARKLIVLPFFLNSGKHTQQDIPEIIEKKREQYPNIEIELKEHLGSRSHMIQLLKAMVSE